MAHTISASTQPAPFLAESACKIQLIILSTQALTDYAYRFEAFSEQRDTPAEGKDLSVMAHYSGFVSRRILLLLAYSLRRITAILLPVSI